MSKYMTTFSGKRRVFLLAGAIAAGLAPSGASAFDSGSTGVDGALNPAVSTEIELPPDGILNYSSVNIPSGVTVSFKRNALNTPIYMLVQGNVTIAGTVWVAGKDGKPTGTYGDGALGDDGVPGEGGPGGYDGGRGGARDAAQTPATIRGGAGLGPGGGRGGIEGGDGCSNNRYWKYLGLSGAFASYGSSGRYNYSGCGTSAVRSQPYGSQLLQPLIGGSGGGGGRGGTSYAGSGGGGGGGAILIAASGTMSITGTINADGGDGGGIAGTGVGGNGAGGSGGAIRLMATTISGGGTLVARGGCRNAGGSRRQDCTGGSGANGDNYTGSDGRIRLEADAITYSGSSTPTRVVDTPSEVFVADVPALRIVSVAGQAVPATPTGSGDVVLPSDVTNPVTVVFETTNIPPGNTVKLRVARAYGDPVEALSPAISGTTESGSTSVQVTLPQGPSVLQATTSFTVTVAMGDSLSRFANNERVERVELVATLGGENAAKLITVSGNTFEVPASILRTVAFDG